ncbi:glycosyl hydrolase [Spirochaeta isovalerica]|uniref:Beta-fructofuranosidase n=1 Tax=Spirochaeta isovalerica TaxID=150 RepID=A0A841REG4_9SPIO|nr:glycosyl hydrolase [Spirochaeta isovalerica]MBB6481390.1 beta-fructofuranosidase [Spirochaeta isovalerica]
MYTGKGFERSELGDIDIIEHQGLFHLFHLVLPNHDYIAHAVSHDGFLWKRVKNPLFIGEPGDWDDDMLWTMHVSADPDGPAAFRMFYTGLSRKEDGKIQRIGLARSNDLYHWEKVSSANYPLSISSPFYEENINEGRNWVSCRDPFFFREGDRRYLLVNARVPFGPIARRGCIGLAEERTPDEFEWKPPLFFPRMYDDVEVPGLHKIANRYYLFGNIKEDVKVHYWYSDSLDSDFEAFASNVLLPRGNYAARVLPYKGKFLVWNFFNSLSDPVKILPPPTELIVNSNGQLSLKSYWLFDEKVQSRKENKDLFPVQRLLKNPTASINHDSSSLSMTSKSGYEIFMIKGRASDFRLKCRISFNGPGKTGLVFRSDREANGHYVSLDLIAGLAQARIWGTREGGGIENAFRYDIIQNNHFDPHPEQAYDVELVTYGGYMELSIDGRIILRYVDTTYIEQESLGFYVESAEIHLEGLKVEILDGPLEEDHQLF